MWWVTSRQFFSWSWPSKNVLWIAATPLSTVPSAANISDNMATFSYSASVKIFRIMSPKDTTRREVALLWCSNNFTDFAILYPPIVLVSTAKTLYHLWTKSTPGKDPMMLLFVETILQIAKILYVMDSVGMRWVKNLITISVTKSLHCWPPTVGWVTLIIWRGRRKRIDFWNKNISAKIDANTIQT